MKMKIPGNRLGLTPLAAMLVMASAVQASDLLNQKQQWVTVAPVPTVTVSKSKPATANISFRIKPGFHINSNHPNSDLLIPTEVQLPPAAGLKVGKIVYPPGKEMSLSFSPDEKLSVYAGEISVGVPLSAAGSAAPGDRLLKGELRYQACNDNSCFPPRTIPFEVPVKIVK